MLRILLHLSQECARNPPVRLEEAERLRVQRQSPDRVQPQVRNRMLQTDRLQRQPKEAAVHHLQNLCAHRRVLLDDLRDRPHGAVRVIQRLSQRCIGA